MLQPRVEDAKVAELHPVATTEFADDLVQEVLHDLFGDNLGIAGLLGDPLAQLALGDGAVCH